MICDTLPHMKRSTFGAAALAVMSRRTYDFGQANGVVASILRSVRSSQKSNRLLARCPPAPGQFCLEGL